MSAQCDHRGFEGVHSATTLSPRCGCACCQAWRRELSPAAREHRCAAPVGGGVDVSPVRCAVCGELVEAGDIYADRGTCSECDDSPEAQEGRASAERLCGAPATTTRTIEDLVVHLCEKCAREVDTDAAEERRALDYAAERERCTETADDYEPESP